MAAASLLAERAGMGGGDNEAEKGDGDGAGVGCRGCSLQQACTRRMKRAASRLDSSLA
jgi:hypothetical protein